MHSARHEYGRGLGPSRDWFRLCWPGHVPHDGLPSVTLVMLSGYGLTHRCERGKAQPVVIIGPVTRKIWTVCRSKLNWPPEKWQSPLTSAVAVTDLQPLPSTTRAFPPQLNIVYIPPRQR
jgi:hypothetical protein